MATLPALSVFESQTNGPRLEVTRYRLVELSPASPSSLTNACLWAKTSPLGYRGSGEVVGEGQRLGVLGKFASKREQVTQ